MGHVVDFISVPNFAIFNIADSAICICMALIVLLNFRGITLLGTRAKSSAKKASALSTHVKTQKISEGE